MRQAVREIFVLYKSAFDEILYLPGGTYLLCAVNVFSLEM